MKNIMILFSVLFLMFCCVSFASAQEEDSAQYKLFAKTLRFDADRLDTLHEIIALDSSTDWAGWANLEIAKLLIKDSKFIEAENGIIEVINNFGSLNDPTGGIMVSPTGAIDYNKENLIALLCEKIPVKLASSARLELSRLYTQMGRNQDATYQLQILIDDGSLQLLSQELDSLGKDMPDYIWYPQQTALRLEFDVLSSDGKQPSAINKLSKLIELYGNPSDVEYTKKALDSGKCKKKKEDKRGKDKRDKKDKKDSKDKRDN